jgi:DNA-binding NarL/FixJ family response regulator
MSEQMSMHRQSPHEPTGQVLQITPWDRQALQLLATGHTKDDVAVGLGISTQEIETQLTTLFAAMGAATQAEAIAVAQRRGLLAWDGRQEPLPVYGEDQA